MSDTYSVPFSWWIGLAGVWMLLVMIPSCGHRQENLILVGGTVEGTSGTLCLLEQKTFELLTIDSVRVDPDGSFRITVPARETGIYALREASGEQVVFIAGPGDTIEIHSRYNSYPPAFSVTGNTETELLGSFYGHTSRNLRRVDSLQLLIEMNQGSADFYELTVRVDSIFNRVWEDQRQYQKDFIRAHAGSFATLLVVNYHFGVKPVLSPQSEISYYLQVDSGLRANYPENSHTLFFHHWVKEIRSSPID